MSWSYTGDPSYSATDEIRFLIDDTVSANSWTLSDEEIAYCVAQAPNNVLLAAVFAADSILGKFSQMSQSKSLGDLSISYSSRHSQYKELAARLRMRATLKAVVPYASGLSRTDKRTVDADADRIAPAAKIDGMNQANALNTDPSTGL
jgi:hypothetical protein